MFVQSKNSTQPFSTCFVEIILYPNLLFPTLVCFQLKILNAKNGWAPNTDLGLISICSILYGFDIMETRTCVFKIRFIKWILNIWQYQSGSIAYFFCFHFGNFCINITMKNSFRMTHGPWLDAQQKKSGEKKLQLDGRTRIPTVKLKIPEKTFLKSESRASVTFKL